MMPLRIVSRLAANLSAVRKGEEREGARRGGVSRASAWAGRAGRQQQAGNAHE